VGWSRQSARIIGRWSTYDSSELAISHDPSRWEKESEADGEGGAPAAAPLRLGNGPVAGEGAALRPAGRLGVAAAPTLRRDELCGSEAADSVATSVGCS